jgi:pimeloyl-ACP methyl ester carboxylesterase/tetratricopeptide (TPR) repeat protein
MFGSARIAAVFLLVSGVVVTGSTLRAHDGTTPLAPELSGLGTLHVPVTTHVPAAQRFFDQGMRLLYAFNHAESIRAFREAGRLDPRLAMAHWGHALALGPNLNAPMSEDNGRRAYAAIQRALALAPSSSARERALIEALARRYAPDGTGDRAALNRAYAAVMVEAAARYPDDPDVQTLSADATMNTMPWDYWQKDGSAKPDTVRTLDLLERVLSRHPDHVGALHYHIHLLEASSDPDRAEPSADRLGSLMPAAGHMVHMPAHIYLRVGRYADAAEANVRAIAADEDYLAQCQAQGLYPVSYYPHNLHFLWAAATLEGRRAVAVDAARQVAAKVPHHHAGAVAWTADFPVTPMLAYARFGLWQEALTEPSPPASQPYAIGIWHYARGLGFVARGQLDRADTEWTALVAVMRHEAFATALKDLPLLGNLQIAVRLLEAEIAMRRGHAERALALAREAVALEDAIPYNEPPVWHQPPRQVLGALLLEAGKAADAERVYREDLTRFRENGWSLFGLARSLEAQRKSSEAADVTRRFEKAWARADVRLISSRIMTTDLPAERASDQRTHGHRGSPYREKRIEVRPGTTLAYVESGDPGGTPVVLLHGYTDSWRSFERVLPYLSSFRVLAVTQRGHGRSDKPAHGYEPADFARDVAAFMDAVGVEQSVLVGHSMGATVAQRFAIDHPGRLLALVLEGAFLPRPGNRVLEEFWTEVQTLRDPIDPGFVRGFQESTLAQPVPREFFQTVVGESLQVPARVWHAALRPYVSLDFVPELRGVRAPTLVIWGDRDAFTPRAAQDGLVAAINGSRLSVYEGAGHSPHWEEPDRFAGEVASFIRGLHHDHGRLTLGRRQ